KENWSSNFFWLHMATSVDPPPISTAMIKPSARTLRIETRHRQTASDSDRLSCTCTCNPLSWEYLLFTCWDQKFSICESDPAGRESGYDQFNARFCTPSSTASQTM